MKVISLAFFILVFAVIAVTIAFFFTAIMLNGVREFSSGAYDRFQTSKLTHIASWIVYRIAS